MTSIDLSFLKGFLSFSLMVDLMLICGLKECGWTRQATDQIKRDSIQSSGFLDDPPIATLFHQTKSNILNDISLMDIDPINVANLEIYETPL